MIESCWAIRGQSQRGSRCLNSTTAAMISRLGPFGPGFDCFPLENRNLYFWRTGVRSGGPSVTVYVTILRFRCTTIQFSSTVTRGIRDGCRRIAGTRPYFTTGLSSGTVFDTKRDGTARIEFFYTTPFQFSFSFLDIKSCPGNRRDIMIEPATQILLAIAAIGLSSAWKLDEIFVRYPSVAME